MQCTSTTQAGTQCKRNASTGTTCKAHTSATSAPIVNLDLTHDVNVTMHGEAAVNAAYAVQDGLWGMDEAQARLKAQDAALFDRTPDAAPIVNPIATTKEETPMVVTDAPADVAPVKPYVDPTHAMTVAIARPDAKPLTSFYKPNQTDQDIQFFNRALAKNKKIRELVMPEYFVLPDYWVASIKLKAGESQDERLIRDWESWRKSYARNFKAGKLVKIDGVWFFAAKISMSAFIALVRAGKRSYCLEYAKDFGTDETSFLGLVGVAELYPLVHTLITDAAKYHTVKRSAKSSADDMADAYETYHASFDAACIALRAIDTAPVVVKAQEEKALIAGAVDVIDQFMDAAAKAMA